MEVVFLIVGIVVGIIIAIIFTTNTPRDRAIGTLWVDKSDLNERPDVYLQLYEDVGDISSKEYVKLKVGVVKRDDSHK